AIVDGLVNDARNQSFDQLAISGFDQLATAASTVFLNGVSSIAELNNRLGCESSQPVETAECLETFGEALIERGSRSGSSVEHLEHARAVLEAVDAIVSSQEQNVSAFDEYSLKVQSLIQYVVLSPKFLLMMESGESGESTEVDGTISLGEYEIASRLAYLLSGAPPDDVLLTIADSETLSDPAVRRDQVDRLLETQSGQARFVAALIGWLGIDPTLANEADIEILFDFVLDWLATDKSFADFYSGGIEVEHLDGSASGSERFGILGSRAFVASHTSFPTPSFITRGIAVVESLLCSELPDGIPAEAFSAGEQTAVEVFEVHSRNECAVCHQVFDNYGALFQNFDPETLLYDPARKPFGDSFELYELGDVSGTVSDVGDFASLLGSSGQAAQCIVELFYGLAVRRSLDKHSADANVVHRLTTAWLNTPEMSARALLREIVASEEFVQFVHPDEIDLN
ncbi:MAG: DUF1592 domain-containing protein, partial [Myxococcota bacterium]